MLAVLLNIRAFWKGALTDWLWQCFTTCKSGSTEVVWSDQQSTKGKKLSLLFCAPFPSPRTLFIILWYVPPQLLGNIFLRRCARNMGVEQAEAWWRTGCGMCQQNKDRSKKKIMREVGRSSTEETHCLWWGLARFFRGASWCLTRAQALQISYQFLRISSPIFFHIFSVGNVVWPGILYPIATLLIFNIPSLAVQENVFARLCEVLACFCFLYDKQIARLLALSAWQLTSSSCCWSLSYIFKLRQRCERS